jgi:hypothetical protein
MKKKYFILLFLTTGIVSVGSAQQTIFLDDFETGYTDGTGIKTTDASWLTVGENFTFPAKNVASSGAASSNWYVRMERGGTTNFGLIEKVFELTAGESYEFKASVFPDISGQKGAYSLKVMDVDSEVALSASPSVGSTWEELSVSYTAAETKNYKFRIQKTWGNQGASIDNYSVICTTCNPLSIKDQKSFDFSVYPNPAKNEIKVSTQVQLQNAKVYNLLGKTMLHINYPSDRINVSSLNAGIYIMSLTSDEGAVVNKKIIIK